MATGPAAVIRRFSAASATTGKRSAMKRNCSVAQHAASSISTARAHTVLGGSSVTKT